MTMWKWYEAIIFVSIFAFVVVFLGFGSEAIAETLKCKGFNHITKAQATPIPDVEGHVLIVGEREGAGMCENGDWSWSKGVYVHDGIKGVGPLEGYTTSTFLDGSTITSHVKGKSEAAQGLPQRPTSQVRSSTERAGSKE